MKIIVFFFLIILLVPLFFWQVSYKPQSGAPPYDAGESLIEGVDEIPEILNWERPDKPLTVGLQVGHWKSDELPEELERLRGNTGATGYGKSEWEVNYEIAIHTKELLEKENIVVDILPATVPMRYWADVFIAIHADGNEDRTKTGFKIAGPRRDYTGKKDKIISLLRQDYADATGLSWDEEGISRNMRGYYAFSWWRFDHAVHPMTPSIILETGFLSTASDASILVDTPQVPAGAIAKALLSYLKTVNI